jgi:hypothetical protein
MDLTLLRDRIRYELGDFTLNSYSPIQMKFCVVMMASIANSNVCVMERVSRLLYLNAYINHAAYSYDGKNHWLSIISEFTLK